MLPFGYAGINPRTKSARVKEGGGRGGERSERRGKRWNVQEKRGLTVRRRQLGRRVDVKNQAYARSPREKGGILYSKLSDFYHCSHFSQPIREIVECR